ncbi:MAG: hypothetical protein ACJ748_16830 [Flavisolibacter sp.]
MSRYILVLIILIDLSFFCNAQTNTFPTTGNVGIGTLSPQKLLHISTSGATEQLIEVTNDGYAALSLKGNGKYWHLSKRPLAEGDALKLYYNNGTSFIYPAFVTYTSTGLIGIGQEAPDSKLTLFTNTSTDGFKINNNNSGWVKLMGNSLAVSNYNNITLAGDGGLIFGSNALPTTYGFVIAPWSSGAVSGLRIDQNGNVGIATADTKGYRFAVNGTAIFTKVLVKTYGTWPDYVFRPQYQLPSLQEIEKYIQLNNHLPEIPSAEEVEKEGLDVATNQAKLLKKIEELTLYIINQNKKIERLESQCSQLNDLQIQLNQLKETINKDEKFNSK